MISKSIQDNTKQQDTAKVIKAAKIVPASKIKSSDGAIIPNEAIAWMELQPSIPVEKEADSMLSTYMLIGVAMLVVLIVFKFLFKKRKPSA